MTDLEQRNIRAMSVDELEVEMVIARVEAKKHADCSEHAACHVRAVTIVNGLLDEWKARQPTPAVAS